jgi:hypothetical protein
MRVVARGPDKEMAWPYTTRVVAVMTGKHPFRERPAIGEFPCNMSRGPGSTVDPNDAIRLARVGVASDPPQPQPAVFGLLDVIPEGRADLVSPLAHAGSLSGQVPY